MSEYGVREAINGLAEARHQSVADIETAEQLEDQAKGLRQQAPRMLDAAIGHAVSQLVADSEAGSLSPRETLEAVLDINQFKPSRVTWSGPPNSLKILDAFDRLLVGGTPFISSNDHRYSLYTGFTGETPPSVRVVEQRGMGSLPGVEISFGSFEVSGDLEDPKVATDETLRILGFNRLERSAIGEDAIQDYIDSFELESHDSTCGCGHHHYEDNHYELGIALNAAKLLARVGDFQLDTEKIDAKLNRSKLTREAVASEGRRTRELLRSVQSRRRFR